MRSAHASVARCARGARTRPRSFSRVICPHTQTSQTLSLSPCIEVLIAAYMHERLHGGVLLAAQLPRARRPASVCRASCPAPALTPRVARVYPLASLRREQVYASSKFGRKYRSRFQSGYRSATPGSTIPVSDAGLRMRTSLPTKAYKQLVSVPNLTHPCAL